MAQPYIFISYSHADKKFATALSDRLRAAKISHFRDDESIDWGEDIPDRVHQALERATHLIVLISPGSEKSQWVAYEMGYARGRQIKVVPYLLHSSMDLPGFIQSKRYLGNAAEERRFLKTLSKQNLPAAKAKRPAGDDSAKASALRKLGNKNPRVRQDGVSELVRMKAGPELVRVLAHYDVNAREAAAVGCSRMAYEPAIPYLVAGMHRLGDRGNKQVIPGVEMLFRPFGRKGVSALLTDTPKQYGEDDRWQTALESVIDNASASVVLVFVAKELKKWVLLPLLKGTSRIAAKDVVSLLAKYFEGRFWLWELKEFFLALKDSQYSTRSEVRQWMKRALRSAIVRISPTSTMDNNGVLDVIRVALTMKLVNRSEMMEIANQATRNSQILLRLEAELAT